MIVVGDVGVDVVDDKTGGLGRSLVSRIPDRRALSRVRGFWSGELGLTPQLLSLGGGDRQGQRALSISWFVISPTGAGTPGWGCMLSVLMVIIRLRLPSAEIPLRVV